MDLSSAAYIKGVRDAMTEAIDLERDGQDAKFGIQGHEDGHWAMIFLEEIGEFARDKNRDNPDRKRTDGGYKTHSLYELVQASTVLKAWAEDIAKRRGMKPDAIRAHLRGITYQNYRKHGMKPWSKNKNTNGIKNGKK